MSEKQQPIKLNRESKPVKKNRAKLKIYLKKTAKK